MPEYRDLEALQYSHTLMRSGVHKTNSHVTVLKPCTTTSVRVSRHWPRSQKPKPAPLSQVPHLQTGVKSPAPRDSHQAEL